MSTGLCLAALVAALAVPGIGKATVYEAASPACVTPPSGLVSWWRAEGNANDVVGANPGTPVGNIVYTNGRVSQAFRFDGRSYVAVPNRPSLNPSGSFSIECWVYPVQDAPYQQILVGKWSDNYELQNQRSYALTLQPGRAVGFAISDAAHQWDPGFHVFFTAAGTVTLQAWNHIAAVYDQSTGTRRIYINGVKAAERTDAPITVLNSTAPLVLGTWYRAANWMESYFVGELDEVSFYNRALTADEVHAIYAAESAGKCAPSASPTCTTPPAGLVSWWRAEGNAVDSVGPYNGTLAGNATYGPGKVGQSLVLDGRGDAVNLGTASNLWLQSFTIETWVRRASTSVVSYDGNGNGHFFTVGGPGTLAFYYDATGQPVLDKQWYTHVGAGVTVTDTNWHHVAVTKNQSAVVFYIDGVAHPGPAFDPGFANGSPAALGGWFYDGAVQNSFYGAIDEVSVYNRALSAAEIQSLYNTDAAGKCFTPVAPTITTPPASWATSVGLNAAFTVAASGTQPLSYQWFFNGEKLNGKTTTSLSLTNVQLANGGTYSVVVSNQAGIASATALLSVTLPTCVHPLPGMVSWWRAESNALDSVDGNLGTLAGNAHYEAGRVGRAFAFDGNRDGVNVGNATNLWLQNFSVEAWIKRASSTVLSYNGNGNGTVFAVGIGGGPAFYLDPSGHPTLSKMQISQVSANTTITDLNWHHVAVTKKESSVVFYVDGTAYPAAAYNPGFVFGSAAVIGAWMHDGLYDNTFYGSIDELAVYNRALTTNEIQAIYLATVTGKCTTPPSIVTQPLSRSIIEGSNATFSVTATGNPVLHYQWLFNGTNLPGATGTALTLTQAQWTNAGSYSVLVANAFGAAVSSNAVLAVDRIPVAQSATMVVAAGPDCMANASVDQGSFDPDNDPLTVSQTPPGPYPLGTNVVTLTVTDNHGASNACTALVVVLDQTSPTLRCPADVVVTNAHAAWTSVVTYAASASDNCSGVGQPVCDPPSGTAFGLGTHTVNCSVTDAAGNAAHGSFKVTVLPGNVPPVPVIEVQPLAHFPGSTNLIVISPDSQQATVVLDGSRSYDVDDASFLSLWYGGTNLLGTNLVSTCVLGLGTNDITLWLDDTFPLGTNSASVAVAVLSPMQAVAIVAGLLQNPPRSYHRDLLASLSAAQDAFKRRDFTAGLNELRAFQHQVSAQVAPRNPGWADALIQGAQQIINALTPTAAPGHAQVKFQSLTHQQGKMHLKFAGIAGKVHLVQASTNMVDWQTIGSATDLGNGSFDFEDTKAAGVPARFYRIVAP